MAIPVPQFQVSALSPANIRRDRDTFFDGIIQTAMGLLAQQAMQEDRQLHDIQMQGIRDTAAKELSFEQQLYAGNVIPYPTDSLRGGDGFSLPNERLTTITGPGRYADRGPYVNAGEVAGIYRSRYMQQPISEFQGYSVRPGTTRADFYTASGSPSLTDPSYGVTARENSAVSNLLRGNASGAAARIDALPAGPEKEAAIAAIEGAIADGFFSLAEENFFMKEYPSSRPSALQQEYIDIEQDVASNASAVAERAREIVSSKRIAKPDGDFAYISYDDASLLAAHEMGFLRNPGEETARRIAQLTENLIDDPSANLGEAFIAHMEEAANPESAMNPFIDWMRSQASNGINPEGFDRYLDLMGVRNRGDADLVAFQSNRASEGLRGYWILQNLGYTDAASAASFLNSLDRPFNGAAIWAAARAVDPTWNAQGIPAPMPKLPKQREGYTTPQEVIFEAANDTAADIIEAFSRYDRGQERGTGQQLLAAQVRVPDIITILTQATSNEARRTALRGLAARLSRGPEGDRMRAQLLEEIATYDDALLSQLAATLTSGWAVVEANGGTVWSPTPAAPGVRR